MMTISLNKTFLPWMMLMLFVVASFKDGETHTCEMAMEGANNSFSCRSRLYLLVCFFSCESRMAEPVREAERISHKVAKDTVK